MPRNTFLDHEPHKPRPGDLGDSNISDKQERRVAKRTGGRRQPGSGSQAHSKGDVKAGKIDPILIECKTTNKKSIRVEKKWLVKITREASAQQRDPVLVASFPEMPSDVDRDWGIIPMQLLTALLAKAEEYDKSLLEK